MLYYRDQNFDEQCRSYGSNPWTSDSALLVKGLICDRLGPKLVSSKGFVFFDSRLTSAGATTSLQK